MDSHKPKEKDSDTEPLSAKSPEEKAKKDNRTFSDKIKEAYTPTPLGGLISMILGILGLIQISILSSGGYGYYWDIVKNLPSNIWNVIISFFSKLF